MISSIFGRTKPINYIFLALFGLIFLVCYFLIAAPDVFSLAQLPGIALNIFLVLFTMMLVEFINRKNDLTRDNTYLSFLFLTFLCMFPRIFADLNAVIAHIFILLAFRRVISIRSGQDVRLKIFDAALWVFVATLLYSWSVVFLLLVFAGIFLYGVNYYKNLLVPLVALVVVAILAITFNLWTGQGLQWATYFDLTPTFTLDKYDSLRFLVPVILMACLGIIGLTAYFVGVGRKSYKARIPGWLILFFFALAVLLVALVESANTSELIFVAFPLCVMIVNYLESLERKWIREVVLWLFLLLPLVALFL
ncbi:DUF6427 family protein [Robertkochia sediminum]|uniref:DUF6427 family protein n=1 Tax=Robertkochia sediminum TaxID=2785326 RepID=UPI001933E8D7|nr:DUF6427 family protein [Robertkochia sediminum]MBL7471766.1 hypothetical protein [Robertkochia sediminum]